MMLYKRPPRPDGFEDRVAAEARRIRSAVQRGEKPAITKSLWRDFKAVFSIAQDGRCGYCEIPVTASHFGDVEHFAPKSAVSQFGNWEAEQGQETEGQATLKNRSPSQRWPRGYWWLAYDWNNYLLACQVCNSVWKGNLYPVKQPPPRGEPAETQQELVLLLNPFGRRDPARHLRFTVDGSVEPLNGSSYGLETIRTCGLGRRELVNRRSWATTRAYGAVFLARREIAMNVPADESKGMKDLYELGQLGAPFPGVTRAIIRQELGLSWSDLEDLFGELIVDAPVITRRSA